MASARGLCAVYIGADEQVSLERARSEFPAAELGAPTATRAVAGACAANRLALVVPCHRVVPSDGALGGYRWGLRVKQSLLEAERDLAAAEGEHCASAAIRARSSSDGDDRCPG